MGKFGQIDFIYIVCISWKIKKGQNVLNSNVDAAHCLQTFFQANKFYRNVTIEKKTGVSKIFVKEQWKFTIVIR